MRNRGGGERKRERVEKRNRKIGLGVSCEGEWLWNGSMDFLFGLLTKMKDDHHQQFPLQFDNQTLRNYFDSYWKIKMNYWFALFG